MTGIMNTTGIQQTAHTTNRLRTIRRALGQVESEGVEATGIILNPTEWEEIETLTDADSNYCCCWPRSSPPSGSSGTCPSPSPRT